MPNPNLSVVPMREPLCEIKDVTQNFRQPSGAPLVVLKDINLQIYPKEVVALLGPSGCGKSTILRILAGLIQPTRGEVLYHSKPLSGLTPGVAIVFQSFALYPWMTVFQNIDVVLKAAGVDSQARKERALNAIRTVGLAGFEEAYPRELSGGMKQRVGMARAFSLNPEMLFMDEPFSQVDALTAESLRAEVLDIWAVKDKNPSSILMVSHDIKEVVYMADRIVVLGTHPGVVRTIVNNTLARPRDYRSPELLQLVDRLHDIITGSELPGTSPRPRLRRAQASSSSHCPTPAGARSSDWSSTWTPEAARTTSSKSRRTPTESSVLSSASVKAAELPRFGGHAQETGRSRWGRRAARAGPTRRPQDHLA